MFVTSTDENTPNCCTLFGHELQNRRIQCQSYFSYWYDVMWCDMFLEMNDSFQRISIECKYTLRERVRILFILYMFIYRLLAIKSAGRIFIVE